MFSNGNFWIIFLVLNLMSFFQLILSSAENHNSNINIINNNNNNNSRSTNNNYVNSSNFIPQIHNLSSTNTVRNATTSQNENFIKLLTTNSNFQNYNETNQNSIQNNQINQSLQFNEEIPDKLQPKTRSISEQLQQHHQTVTTGTQNAELPIFPERNDAVYFIVAVIGGAETWGRIIARTLLEMGPPFGSPMGPPLRPLYVKMPPKGKFTVNVLTELCDKIENTPLAGVVVIGDGKSARAVALSGNAMKVPVLWARGGTATIHGIQREAQTTLQSMLQPAAREILKAVRALFLQTHWYSFFVLSDVEATMVLASFEGRILKEPPLVPNIIPLPAGDGDVFRQLAQISRSTRGIVLLLCNLVSARKIMSEAKRLNMAGGHFIWLWADTSSTTEFFDLHHSQSQYTYSHSHNNHHQQQQQSQPQQQPQQPQQHHKKLTTDEQFSELPEGIKTISNNQNYGMKINNRGGTTEKKNILNRKNINDDNDDSITNNKFQQIPSNRDQSPSNLQLNSGINNNPDQPYQLRLEQNLLSESVPLLPVLPSTNDLKQSSRSRSSSSSTTQFKKNNKNTETLEGRYILGINSNENLLEKSNQIKRNININNNDYFYDTSNSDELSLNNFENSDIDTTKESASHEEEEITSLEFDHNYSGNWFTLNDSTEEPLLSSQNTASKQVPLSPNGNKYTKKLKLKRTSTSGSGSASNNQYKNLTNHYLSSDVLFHHFKDFPIGLLALCPIKMPVDQNFIKSTIRLFASTWAQIEQKLQHSDDYDSQFNKRFKFPYNSDPISSSNSENKFSSNFKYYYNSENNNYNEKLVVNQRNNDYRNNNPINYNYNMNNLENKRNNRSRRFSRKYHWRRSRLRRRRRRRRRSLSIHNYNEENVDDDDVDVDDNNDNIETVNTNFNIENNNNNLNNLNVATEATNINVNSTNLISDNLNNLTSDLNEILTNSNNNLSGLTTQQQHNNNNNNNLNNYLKINQSNIMFNTNNNLIKNKNNIDIVNMKQKRQNNNAWWSASPSPSSLSRDGAKKRFKSSQQTTNQQQQQQQQQAQQQISNGRRVPLVSSYYRGGCFENPNTEDIKRAELFAKALKETTEMALSGQRLPDGFYQNSLTTNFELLNLVPDNAHNNDKTIPEDSEIRRRGPRKPENQLVKWRRVGAISGQNVQLDTIVWPGGDIVVSGLSAQSRTVFRIVTALAPPFVMQSEMDEDGLCLRGLPCHRLLPSGEHNLTLMFNAIETHYRLKEDAAEHGAQPPNDNERSNYDHSLYSTKCCYGLSMDLLDTIANDLEFEFHLYIVKDELFGTKYSTLNNFLIPKSNNHKSHHKKPRKSHWNLKNMNKKDQYTNRIHHPPEGRSIHSASIDRNPNLNRNSGHKIDEMIPRSNSGHQLDFNGRIVMIDENEDDDDADADEQDNKKNPFTDWENVNREREEFFDENNSDEYEVEDKDSANQRFSQNSELGRKKNYRKKAQWNGIIGDLISGSADMSFSPLTISRARSKVIDFSAPYFHSGVSLLAAPQSKSEIPLLAFLLPFSPELWIAIFTSLNVTAIAVAIYEWLSPFGLNPWGRQRSKNFSMSSALWVMWGLLCGHLVAFKAPKSWPNKFLINVWGGFSVIFIASYTANIAALIAGLFFHNAGNRPEVSLLTQRVGAPVASATESFMKEYHHHTWEHMKKFTLPNLEDGIHGLKNGTLDLVLGDTAILDYYRATDHGCNLAKIGEPYVDDTYAIGMTKGFPLKESISSLIAKYSANGYLDILTEKWYGGLPCYKLDNDIVMPRPLGVEAVAGVFLLLGLGMVLGILILIFEHAFFKYTLPSLRLKPKGTVWRSRNIMFFSQKLYRFINCVELVSPHHAARELVHTLRQGQIASLFQKSIKRKEDEQRRRRKSKAQFFEMIQEIRRVQQAERMNPKLEVVTEAISESNETPTIDIPEIILPSPRPSPKPKTSPKPKSSPIQKIFRGNNRSRSNSSTLSVRRFSTDSLLSDRLDTIGRRLSRDLTNSPPDFGRRFDTFGKNNGNHKQFQTSTDQKHHSDEKLEETKFETLNINNKKLFIEKGSGATTLPAKKYQNRRTPLNTDAFINRSTNTDELPATPASQFEIPSKNSLIDTTISIDRQKSSQRNPLYASIEPRKNLNKKSTHENDKEKQRVVNRSNSSSQTSGHVLRNSRPIKRLNQPLHHRQRSLDGLDSRPPMPLPTASPPQVLPQSTSFRPQSRDRLDVSGNAASVATDMLGQFLSKKVSGSHSNDRIANECNKRISLERLSREDLLKLSESSQTEIHEYLSQSTTTITKKSNTTDHSLEPP